MGRVLVVMVVMMVGGNGLLVAEEVEHPTYRSWAQHPLGTSLVLEKVTEAGGVKQSSLERQTLLAVAPEKVVVNVRRLLADGTPDSSKESETLEYARGFLLLPGVKKEDVGKPRGDVTGEEELVVAGKSYHAMWYETKGSTEAGPSTTRTWIANEVPGRLLMSVTEVPKVSKKSTLRVLELTIPGR